MLPTNSYEEPSFNYLKKRLSELGIRDTQNNGKKNPD